jgi:signal transduction histidine kinase
LEHEKLSLLSELAASISHELNTPFGIIKNGAIEVNNSIISLVESIENGTYPLETLHFVISVAQKKSNITFASGRQKRRDLIDFSELLYSKNIDSSLVKDLAQAFVHSKFDVNELTEIDFILNSKNQLDILQLIFFLQKTLSLSKSIIETSNSAALIVKELTNFAKGSKSQEIVNINLNDVIQSVLSVYKFHFETISIHIEIDQNIEILGNEINLFQLWKNAFLLASYCFEENDIENYIRVTATETEQTILIQFNYNGEKINPELITNLLDVTPIIDHSNKNILDKLSLIKKITTDHNGKFNIISSDELTTLNFEFNRFS